MATFKILYWKDIPSQITVEDSSDEVRLELGPAFQERIDAVATQQGLIGSDAYLDFWHWSEEEERPGSAQEVAEALQRELAAKFGIESG